MSFKNKQLEKVTRVEVIDENGRSYVNWDKNNRVSISFQDDAKTLKIFIAKPDGEILITGSNPVLCSKLKNMKYTLLIIWLLLSTILD